MQFYSTNHHSSLASLREAVLGGIAPDGGLYMPTEIPKLPNGFLDAISGRDAPRQARGDIAPTFAEIAFDVAKIMIGNDVPESVLQQIVTEAYDFAVPLVEINSSHTAGANPYSRRIREGPGEDLDPRLRVNVLELFHGPTLAFKDFPARFMARLMAYFNRDEDRELTILVATSGDTGSAVASGFLNIPGIRVIILYPSGKVSPIQEAQLTTMGANVTALEVDGFFDDCQRLVKQVFLDPEITQKIRLTAANSINIARLIPQMFYYFWAYVVRSSELGVRSESMPLVISVPSGNFGNLTAGLMAKRMGLPIDRFIAATNVNDVVPQYLESGFFEPRASRATISNAMDVGNPSNFARMLALYEGDVAKMRQDIVGYRFTDNETKAAMREVFEQCGYVMDPHGAVAYLGLQKYAQKNAGAMNGVFLETAHPAKFLEVVEETLQTKVEMPERLKAFLDKPKRSIEMTREFEEIKRFLMAF